MTTTQHRLYSNMFYCSSIRVPFTMRVTAAYTFLKWPCVKCHSHPLTLFMTNSLYLSLQKEVFGIAELWSSM